MKFYMALLFILTFAVGIAEMVNEFGVGIPFIPEDIFGGIAMLVISATFLRGLLSEQSDAYFYIGSLLLLVFGVLYILVLLANGLDFLVLGKEEFGPWNPINDLRPEILLIPLAIPGILLMNKVRREFSR